MDVNSSDGLDLTPRTGPGDPSDPRSGAAGGGGGRGRGGAASLRRWVGVAVLVVVVGLGAVVVVRSLDDATLFFRNADEAVTQRDDLGTSRFRLQGLVVPGSVEAYPGGVAFDVGFNGTIVPVEHSGDPVELFDDGIPVVLEGRWSGTNANAVYLSDRMLVKHDENYIADNGGRLDEADDGSGYGSANDSPAAAAGA